MLRRRFLVIFGSLVVLLAGMAFCAIWALQNVLEDLDRTSGEAMAVVDDAGRLTAAINVIEIELYQLRLGQQRHLDELIGSVEEVRRLADRIGLHSVVREGKAGAHYNALQAKLPGFARSVGALATAQDPELAREYDYQALTAAVSLRESIRQIDLGARDHARREQQALAGRFRWMILGMALGCLLALNVCILFLLRSAAMVLRPVDTLVEASRQLTSERFDYRAHLDRNDEFFELAQAYNSMAERLQTNEQRKMEMLGQVALTLNHELNNAIATIEMQLQVLGRQAAKGSSDGPAGNDKVQRYLRQIQESLQRMTHTVEAMEHIRRIVLTDYVAGVKMLDLQRSVEAGPEDPDPMTSAVSENRGS